MKMDRIRPYVDLRVGQRARLEWLATQLELSAERVIDDLLEAALMVQVEQNPTTEAVDILVSESHGIYIPATLAERTEFEDWDGIRREDWDALVAGPDHDWYWEAMNLIEQNAVYVGAVKKWQGCGLYYNGDLFIVSPNYRAEDF